jgi:O-antigen ligase
MNALGTLVLYGKPRVSSVALEPSILSQQLLTVIPVLFWGLIYRQTFFGLRLQKLLLISIICTLLLAQSSTAYMGLFCFVCIVITTFILQNKIPKKILYAMSGLVIIFVSTLPLLINQILHKLETYSGIERFKSLSFAWHYFTEYPILGIGWGVMPSWDFIVCILAGMGIIGLVVFTALLIICFYNIKRQLISTPINQPFLLGINQGLLLLLFVSQSSGFIYHSLYFWLMLGFAISAASLRPHI